MNHVNLRTILLVATGCLGSSAAADYQPQVFTNPAGTTLPYRLLTPKHLQASTRYPLVVFLHGAGERGTDNSAQLIHGTKLFLEPKNREKYPCFVIAPQCPEEMQWVDMPWTADKGTQPANPSVALQLVIELIDHLSREHAIDPDRIYLTGLSMGGFGVWDLITRYPGRYAAAAPVCGGGDEAVAARAAKVPIWTFHSDDDSVVKVFRTRNMLAEVRAAGGKPKYFQYAGLGHNSWATAYREPELLPWLFAQRRGKEDTFVLKTKPPVVVE